MASNRPTRLLAGAAHSVLRTGEKGLGGLYSFEAGSSEYHAISAGLPEKVDVYVILVHPANPDVLYIGTQDGPYRSTDRGEHWERLGFPDRNVTIWSLAIHPTRPNVMYAGAQRIALYRSEDGGDTWRKLPQVKDPEHCGPNFLSRLIRIGLEASRPDEIYLGLEVSGVLHSADNGETWKDLSAPLIKLAEKPHLQSNIRDTGVHEGMMDTHSIVLTGAAPKSAVLATRMGLFKTDDGGSSWHDMEIGRFTPVTYCRDLRVSPHDAKVLYACVAPYSRSHDGALYRSDDVAQSWRRIDHGVQATGTMMSMAEHPRDPARVCCISRMGEVFATEDAAASWQTYRLPAGVLDAYAVACI